MSQFHAAELGDARSAEVLALMYRFGPRLYPGSVPDDAAEAAEWVGRGGSRRTAARSIGGCWYPISQRPLLQPARPRPCAPFFLLPSCVSIASALETLSLSED